MSRKTYRINLELEGDPKGKIYRTDGIPTHCCSMETDYFIWEKNTKHNNYQGYSGYVSASTIERCLRKFNPDNLTI